MQEICKKIKIFSKRIQNEEIMEPKNLSVTDASKYVMLYLRKGQNCEFSFVQSKSEKIVKIKIEFLEKQLEKRADGTVWKRVS